ncbi:major capsid protein [Flyfo microvirus Tbat2_103]|nr:major capsid protein [Flyfo microvirus Tbat2_103]
MAKNPFTSVSDVTRKIGKNYYDWSHDYNFTGKIGTIYPVFAKYCPAGQSLSIDAVAGLQFMPMQFPVQSKMKLKLSFWRMPLRAMWKDYTNFVSSQNQPDVQSNYVAPFIDFNHSGAYTDMLAVGGLCDYLRMPVTQVVTSFDSTVPDLNGSNQPIYQIGVYSSIHVDTVLDFNPSSSTSSVCSSSTAGLYTPYYIPAKNVFPPVKTSLYRVSFEYFFEPGSDTFNFKSCFDVNSGADYGLVFFDYSTKKVLLKFKALSATPKYDKASVVVDYGVVEGDFPSELSPESLVGVAPFFPTSEYAVGSLPSSTILSVCKFRLLSSRFYNLPAPPLSNVNSPYFDSASVNSSKQLKISAYPFRMYEAIYNAYIRYIRNNPFKKDGKPVYNEWLPTMEGGADKTPYKLYRCNWAADAYTTAVQSPQQGVAPVVGLSQATVMSEDGVNRVLPAITTEDGKVYGLEYTSDEFGLTGVDYTELGTGAKVAPVHSMYSLAQSGISIEDFRMTNAYQRYLELNMMRGYSYKQIVEGRFEVNVKYDDLLMPEFCGGMTRDVFVSGVQQNVEDNGGSGTYVGSLGSEAGVAGCRGDLGHKIKIYCDEASYVMCLAYVVPQSIYSQICPKDFLYRDLLDAWSPEFDQIGFQPIKKSELCPVESWNSSPDSLNDTFGFQRPWYEYCEVPDASVGLFNTELRNFLMHRVFSSTPQLGEKFTTVNSSSVDHVFSVTEFTDKFFGQIHFSIDVKSPVSRVVIPSLE